MAASIFGQPPSESTPSVEVWITPVIERDFIARDVFPALRIENAKRVTNGRTTGLHELSIADAEAVLKDAEEQYTSGNAQRRQRGGSLRGSLEPAIKHAKGLWDAPGAERARERVEAAFARFEVGSTVLYWSPNIDDERDGDRMIVTRPYGLYTVYSDEGAFVDREGKRLDYMWGYFCRWPHEKQDYFFYPYMLQTLDRQPGYLRLVTGREASHG